MTVAPSRSVKVTLPSDDDILMTREFDAPPHLVFKAWTTPELVRRWWAGRRGEVKIAEIDLRVGGMWRFVMVAEGGFDVAFHGTYQEIVPDQRIVTTEVFEAMGGDGVINEVSFIAAGDGTRLEYLVKTDSRATRDMILESGMEKGVQEQMALLEEIAGALG
jgi:uncharacterized protein YndB with AHSA1/START domain